MLVKPWRHCGFRLGQYEWLYFSANSIISKTAVVLEYPDKENAHIHNTYLLTRTEVGLVKLTVNTENNVKELCSFCFLQN